MPRFYLNLRRGNDHLPNDHEPQEFPDLAAARTEAIESLREMSAHASKEKRRLDYDGIDILGQDGSLLLRVPMSEAVNISSRRQSRSN
jgi:Domain of unknown function (DUF6894)